MSSRITSFDQLYTIWVNLITHITGRQIWREQGIRCNPSGAYGTIYMTEGPSPTQEVVELIQIENPANDTDPTLMQEVWGTTRVDCRVKFYRDKGTERALSTAVKFRNALQLEERFNDIWQYCGLVGEIRTIDTSGMFREDIEGRAEVRFSIYANITSDATAPTPVDITLHQIDNVNLEILVDEPQDFLIEKVINYTEEQQ